MTKRKTLISLLLCISAFTATFSALADNNIKINHEVSPNQTEGIVLLITLNNLSNQDLVNASLFPTGEEFTKQENVESLTIGDIAMNDQITIEMTANTTMPVTYFQSGLPIFFHLTATNAFGENIDIPVYSLGGAQ